MIYSVSVRDMTWLQKKNDDHCIYNSMKVKYIFIICDSPDGTVYKCPWTEIESQRHFLNSIWPLKRRFHPHLSSTLGNSECVENFSHDVCARFSSFSIVVIVFVPCVLCFGFSISLWKEDECEASEWRRVPFYFQVKK